jgi:hypothetical protein
MKRYTFRFGDPTSADLEWLATQMHDGNIKATLAELVRNERRRLEGPGGDLRWGLEADAKEFLRDGESQPKGTKKVLVEVIKPLADSIRAQEAVPVLQEQLRAAQAQEDVDVAPEPQYDPEKAAEEFERAKPLVTPEMLAAAAERLQAKKTAPKPFTGITQQA